MSMSLTMLQTIYIRCDCCNGSTEDHEQGCPRQQMKHLLDRLRGPECPVCPYGARGRLLQNQDDFLECNNKRCRAVFTRSLLAGGYDPDKLTEHEIIDYDENQFYTVLQFPKKGKGKFQYLGVMQNIKESISYCKALMKEERRRRSKSEKKS